jgi:hypothetical protein
MRVGGSLSLALRGTEVCCSWGYTEVRCEVLVHVAGLEGMAALTTWILLG